MALPMLGNEPPFPGIVHIVNAVGDATWTTSSKPVTDFPATGTVLGASGTKVVTGHDAYAIMVCSTFVGLYITADTSILLEHSRQTSTGEIQYETAKSTSRTRLHKGVIGICAPKMYDTSSLQYITTNVAVEFGGGKMVMKFDDTGTWVNLLSGYALVMNLVTKEHTIHRGPTTVHINLYGVETSGAFTADMLVEHVELARVACIARKLVHFNLMAGTAGEPEILSVPAVPTENSPTISPARIGW